MFTAKEMHQIADSNQDKKMFEGLQLVHNAIKIHAEAGDYCLKVDVDKTLTIEVLTYVKECLEKFGFECIFSKPSPIYEQKGFLTIKW